MMSVPHAITGVALIELGSGSVPDLLEPEVPAEAQALCLMALCP
ncbi:MAG TPA: hypothetical protein VF060_22215 [Trebonia sp.]